MQLGIVDPNGPLDEQVSAMDRACRELGFFRIPIGVVAPEIREAAWDAAAAFFTLGETTKREIEFPEPGYPYGYSPFGAETLAKSLDDTEAPPDLKESLSVGPDCGPTRTPVDGEDWIMSPSLWPANPPELAAAWTAYYQALSDVSEQLMRIMALALQLPADHFTRLIDRPITSMRAIHYPATPTRDESLRAGAHSDSLRAGAHSDYGTFTILRTDHVPGLEIMGPDGDWIPVDPDPNFFIVNLGDTIAQWTNDRWRSTLHRVVPAAEPRQSFAFFHMANWDAVIECLPTCLGEGETPRHEPVQAGPWLMRKFQSTVV